MYLPFDLWNRWSSLYRSTVNHHSWSKHPPPQRHSSHTSFRWSLYLPGKNRLHRVPGLVFPQAKVLVHLKNTSRSNIPTEWYIPWIDLYQELCKQKIRCVSFGTRGKTIENRCRISHAYGKLTWKLHEYQFKFIEYNFTYFARNTSSFFVPERSIRFGVVAYNIGFGWTNLVLKLHTGNYSNTSWFLNTCMHKIGNQIERNTGQWKFTDTTGKSSYNPCIFNTVSSSCMNVEI